MGSAPMRETQASLAPGQPQVGGQANALRLALGLGEAAAALGVSRFTVARLVRSGKLRGVRVGRRVVVPLAALEEFLGRSVL